MQNRSVHETGDRASSPIRLQPRSGNHARLRADCYFVGWLSGLVAMRKKSRSLRFVMALRAKAPVGMAMVSLLCCGRDGEGEVRFARSVRDDDG